MERRDLCVSQLTLDCQVNWKLLICWTVNYPLDQSWSIGLHCVQYYILEQLIWTIDCWLFDSERWYAKGILGSLPVVSIVSFPDPPWKVEEGLVFWATFLVTWGGAIHHKECHNCIFKSGTWFSDSSVHMDYYTATLTKKLEMAARSTGTAENRLRDKFSLLPIRFRIRPLTSCKYNYIFCNLIGDLKSKTSPAPCDKKMLFRTQEVHVLFSRVHLGMRWRLQASSQRDQWCGAVSALRQLNANVSWDHNLCGKRTTTLILVTLKTYAWPFSYNNWWLHVPTAWGHTY